MRGRIIEIKDEFGAARELSAISCDKRAIALMAPKSFTHAVKLSSVAPAPANIIKQEMLSFGGEAATAYGAIDHSVKTTDVLILGTMKQLRLLVDKLKMHPFGLPEIAKEIDLVLTNYHSAPKPIEIKNKILDFGQKTYLMGILNITPDSFSDGGEFMDVGVALTHAEQMLEDGADIIDIGGESTRPGAEPVVAEEEKKRVLPVIEKLAAQTEAVISIDTTKAAVAKAALACGAHMVNDISGLRFDPAMAEVVADYKVPVCIMHIQGNPRNMQQNPAYSDLMGETINYLEEGLAIAQKAGILHDKIIVDPGIGFGKTLSHNLEILKKLKELKVLGRPILVGPSRKSLIGKVLELPENERLEGSMAAVAVSIANGANIVRVHDVRATARVARMTDAIVKNSIDLGRV